MSADDQKRRTLAFWGANMVYAKRSGIPAMGFSYTPEEWSRFEQFDAEVGDRFMLFLTLNTVLFIIFAALCIGVVFIPLMSYLYPDPSKTPAVVFLGGLAATSALAIGFGLPLSMQISAAWSAPKDRLETGPLSAADQALAGKARFQLWRMTLILCGLLTPGALLLIAFNIDAGPLVIWLKTINAIIVAASLVSLYRQRAARAKVSNSP